jgi:protein pelota
MKIVFQDLKKGEIKVLVQSLDDLWYLAQIIEEEDLVSGITFRKIKIGSDENAKVVKKSVHLEIEVEKVDFSMYGNSLRISGKVKAGPEDVPLGSYHTIDVEEESVITIKKESWPSYQLQKIKDAQEHGEKILIVALERDEATYALLTNSGYKIIAEVEGDVEKKGIEDKREKEFFEEVAKNVEEYATRFSVNNIILASPAFWKEDLAKIIKKKHQAIANKITLATCNTTGVNAIEEVLKRDEVKQVLKKDRTTRETNLVEELFKEIAKNANAAYGWIEVKQVAETHNVKKLLVSDQFIREKREKKEYKELDSVMKEVDRSQGEVHIISTEHDAGKRLHGLGGIGAILRYRLY